MNFKVIVLTFCWGGFLRVGVQLEKITIIEYSTNLVLAKLLNKQLI